MLGVALIIVTLPLILFVDMNTQTRTCAPTTHVHSRARAYSKSQ